MSFSEHDINSQLAALTVQQKAQVDTHVNGYRSQLLNTIPPIAPHTVDSLVSQFRKTLITQVYKKFAASNANMPKPQPPTKQHPLSISTVTAQAISAAAAKRIELAKQASPQFADVNVAGKKVAVPISCRDWILQLMTGIEYDDAELIAKAEKFVEYTLGKFHGASHIDWTNYPIPTHADLRMITLAKTTAQPKKVEPVKRAAKSASDFIPLAQKKVKLVEAVPSMTQEELARRRARAEKYAQHLGDVSSAAPEETAKADVSYDFGDDADDVFDKTGRFAVVGQCRVLEKSYFRLTSAPDPSLVRPERVLSRHLENLESSQRDYAYISNQLRAIRQDLTVQAVKNDLTVRVYEFHARLALANADLGQFNQCQTQLKELHGISNLAVTDESKAEFLCYSLIYFVMQGLRIDQIKFLAKWLNLKHLQQHPYVQFALEVRSSLALGNYAEFFHLFALAEKCLNGTLVTEEVANSAVSAPKHAWYLLNAFADKQRLLALVRITRAFPSASLDWLSKLLGFRDEVSCSAFLIGNDVVMKDTRIVDCKASSLSLSEHPLLQGRKHTLMG